MTTGKAYWPTRVQASFDPWKKPGHCKAITEHLAQNGNDGVPSVSIKLIATAWLITGFFVKPGGFHEWQETWEPDGRHAISRIFLKNESGVLNTPDESL